jgi:hypothetical protein
MLHHGSILCMIYSDGDGLYTHMTIWANVYLHYSAEV